LNGRCAVYQRDPSKAAFSKVDMQRNGKEDKVLKIRFDKKNTDGPDGTGGWCGYYTIVKQGNKYLDVKGYKKLTFWVKGENGGEKFKIGAADQAQEAMDDSAKSDDVTSFIPSKKITKEWQKVSIPMESIFIEWTMLASISINFEADLYEDGSAKGTVYIDDIQFEK
ncbi:MAG: carbohydrate binding domain-containing protein, partial [bacterium]|nr:carbohydrate binding domain-containing protein [bacterium]